MKSYIILAAALTTAIACDNDPVGEAHQTQASAPVEAPAKEASAQAKKFAISADNSALEFVGAKVTATHPGAFKKFSGTVSLVDSDPTKSSVTVTIDMSSFTTDKAKLTTHLQSPDFFDVAKFPEAKFESTKIAKKGSGFEVTGNLTLRGVSKSITFPANIKTDAGVSVKAEFGINRQDFGVVYPGMPDDLIKDEILIKLTLSPNAA